MMKNYFIDELEYGFGKTIVLKEKWNDNLFEIISKNNISGIRLSKSEGWSDNNVFFLSELKYLNCIEIYSWDIKDVSPLKYIRKLIYLGLQCKFDKAPDFSDFKDLEICMLQWNPLASGIFECKKIRYLNIIEFPYIDLESLIFMKNIKDLSISSKYIESLNHIEKLTNIERIDLADCKNLYDIKTYSNDNKIREIEIDNCPNVYDIEGIGGFSELKKLYIIDCKKIKSLRPLLNCNKLEEIIITGNTIVEDGDFGDLIMKENLDKFVISNRSHYSHSQDEIAKIVNG